MKPVRWLVWLAYSVAVFAQEEVDNEESRKVLGSSVVTSVSVIMDHGNGTKTYITDAAGQPLDQTEGIVGSPVDLLNPDRYEFYTFDETGDLVKKLMTLDQIKGLLAGGDGESLDNPSASPTFYHESLSSSHLDDSDLEPHMAQGVHNVVASVQNVLRSELEATKTKGTTSKPPLNIPDSISSWSMLFPAIISDSEALDDDNDSGNSVNEPIVGGDRLPAASNDEKTEVKIPSSTANDLEENTVTGKPTAVPPIIHFLEIHSVPSPLKNPTKTPGNITSTTPVASVTSRPPTTTNKPTSPVNPIQEMSASISSLLSQVTNAKPSADGANSAEESKISISTVPSPTTGSPSTTSSTKLPQKPTTNKPQLKPESSNVNTVTKSPPKSTTVSSKNKPNTVANSANNKNSKPINKTENNKNTSTSKIESAEESKRTNDTVVLLITTAKPTSISTQTSTVKNNKTKPPSSTTSQTNKQKIQATTPISTSTIKKTNVKNQATSTKTGIQTTDASSKKPAKPSTPLNKGDQSGETLEAHGSEDVIKVVPTKQAQTTASSNQIKNNQTKINSNSNVPSAKPTKKVPSNKPHNHEDPSDCVHSKKPGNEVKDKENLEVAASSNLNESIQPSKPVLQEVKIIQKPVAASQSAKPSVIKVKPSQDIKITTYKPSTSQPFTTKQSINKISTTTERPVNEQKIASPSKIHEVNSSLLDIKNHVLEIKSNQTEASSSLKTPTLNSTNSIANNYIGAASNANGVNTSAPIKENETKNSSLKNENSTTETIDHSAEVPCVHSKKPIHTSIQDKISDLNHDFAASNTEEVKLTTVELIPTTITTEASPETTELATETPDRLTERDELTTTEQLRETTDLPETTTLNLPDMDVVKEGISAVTNILLDVNPPIEPQLPLPTLPLSESASNIVQSPPVEGELKHAASFDDFELTTTDLIEDNDTKSTSTTEKELIVYFTTTDDPTSETLSTTESEETSTKSGEDTSEQVIDAETVSPTEVTTTESSEETEQKESSESKIISTTLNNQTLPTKESKLGPENIEDSTNSAVLCNHTLSKLNATKNLTTETIKNKTETKDNLEPAQSIISEVSKTNEINITPASTITIEGTTPKTSQKNENDNVDLKTALKPDPSKYTLVKYPNLQNNLRPTQEKPASPPTAVELHPAPHESLGLEATTAFLADDVRRFSDLCNELAFRMWTSITGKGSITSRSLVLSPFATTSLLAMVFLGARGPTSGQMNDVLRLDDMVTFNPHQVLQNVTESVLNSRNYGVTTAAFVRELYSDKLKGKILDFYKERAQQYYDGHVEEISFNAVGDILRRRTNLLVKRQTLGKVPEYLRGSNLSLRPPLAAFSANIFQTDCDLASTEGRDGEMYFVVRPSTRQRRLVPVPAAVWRTGFLAGYEPGLDATAVALGTDSVVSTILVLPGQQGQVAPGDGLARLEQRLIETSYRRGGWTRLLRSLLPRPGLELQVPRFSHRSVLNVTSTLQRMGLKDLFNENKADLRGLNGLSNDLHLSDMVQVNTFSTCGDDTIGARHHIETYPVSPQRMGRDDPELYPRPEDLEDADLFRIPLNLRPRQARLPDSPRLRFDRPFLYMVRHNPTGMILHMGRFNPRLLP